MTNMMTVAFQSDLTRVVTFLVTHEGTSRAYREIDIPDGHHPLTHHRNQPDLIEKVTQINTYHVRQFAELDRQDEEHQGGRRTLLDNSHDRLRRRALRRQQASARRPADWSSAGRGGSNFVTGRSIVYRKETPMCNMFLTMMDRMGVPTEHFGDSSGPLDRPGPRPDPCSPLRQPNCRRRGWSIDSNLGQGIDSVLALALLHGFAGKQQCRVASLTVNYPDLRAAQLCDAIERFYSSAANGDPFGPARSLPLGIVEGKNPPANLPVLAKAWKSDIRKWNDTAIPELVMRNALMANYDGNAVMVLCGPATNLASLLKLADTAPLLAAKVRAAGHRRRLLCGRPPGRAPRACRMADTHCLLPPGSRRGASVPRLRHRQRFFL